MNKKALREKLELKKKSLELSLKKLKGESVSEADRWVTQGEVGDEAAENTEGLTQIEKEELYTNLLEATNKALTDLDNDRYGVCNKCECEIGEERLAKIPDAQYCIACQEIVDAAQ